jgi:hypothetical protein
MGSLDFTNILQYLDTTNNKVFKGLYIEIYKNIGNKDLGKRTHINGDIYGRDVSTLDELINRHFTNNHEYAVIPYQFTDEMVKNVNMVFHIYIVVNRKTKEIYMFDPDYAERRNKVYYFLKVESQRYFPEYSFVNGCVINLRKFHNKEIPTEYISLSFIHRILSNISYVNVINELLYGKNILSVYSTISKKMIASKGRKM